MIAVSAASVNRALALANAVRRYVQSLPSDQGKGLILTLEYFVGEPLGIDALYRLEDELAGAEEIPLTENL
jgi:hypothetical protein